MKRPKAPSVVKFEGLNDMASKWSWKLIGYRCPNKGEFFLSGGIPEAYKAKQHLTTEYFVVEPLVEHKLRSKWLPISEPGDNWDGEPR